jgi:hypothetical protein
MNKARLLRGIAVLIGAPALFGLGFSILTADNPGK